MMIWSVVYFIFCNFVIFFLASLLLHFCPCNFWVTVCKMVRRMLSYCCLSMCVCLVTLVYCGQTVGWISMPIGMEVGLGPGHCVRWDPAPPKVGTAAPPPIFGACLLWQNGWMDQDATWYGGRPRPRWHCERWVHTPTERATAAPTF